MIDNYQKEKLTKIVRDNLPNDSPFKNLDLQTLLFQWWSTGRQSQNLRLSDIGKQAFEDANIQCYDFSLITDKIKVTPSQFTIKLKKIKCPFYLGLKSKSTKTAYIRIYDSKIATIISLFGSFHEYLESLDNVE
jgi:hypothetical protein